MERHAATSLFPALDALNMASNHHCDGLVVFSIRDAVSLATFRALTFAFHIHNVPPFKIILNAHLVYEQEIL